MKVRKKDKMRQSKTELREVRLGKVDVKKKVKGGMIR